MKLDESYVDQWVNNGTLVHTTQVIGYMIKNIVLLFLSGTGRVPDQLVNLDMKHGVEAKNYEEVSVCFLL